MKGYIIFNAERGIIQYNEGLYLIHTATDEDVQEALSIVTQEPLENITLIADLTQLRDWCDIRACRQDGRIRGIFALYHDLDFLAGAFWAESSSILSALVNDYGQKLKRAQMVFICTEEHLETIRQVAKSVDAIKERQMVMDCHSQLMCDSSIRADLLTFEDTEDLRELYHLSGTPAWTPNALKLGPFFGVRDDRGKVVSVAGVHFVNQYSAEIGNIATHPEHRRKGYAQSSVAAVTKELLNESDTVVLHFFDDNIAAQKLYEKMGFRYSSADPIYFTKVEF